MLTPKIPKKKPKKTSQFTNFGVATGFFCFFLGFFGFLSFFGFFGIFWFFLVFWDGILTLKSNAKKNQKIPKKKTKKTQNPVSNFECWPKLKPKKTKKTKKNRFPISNSGQNQCQKKPKKNQKKKTIKNQENQKNQCQFGNFKKPKKDPKKTNANLPILV